MDYNFYLKENKALQVESLAELIAVKSVLSDPVRTKDGQLYPFGKGVQEALEYMLDLGEKMGFETKNVDNYGGHIDFGYGEEIVGILGHLDVVPEGTGWSFDPFSGAVSNGFIYGRGAQDDKGPMMACLFAMKALKDAGYEPARKVRMILGLDEETKWEGVEYYFAKEKRPTFGFTPDAEFPALNGEKGILRFDVAKKLGKNQEGLMLRSLAGGDAPNQVPEKVRAVVFAQDRKLYENVRAQAEIFKLETNYKLNLKNVGKSLEIVATGKSAHAATPDAGLNAISIMMSFLGRLNFACDELNVFLDFYNKHIGFNLHGEAIECQLEDEESGKLTMNAGVITYDQKAISLTIDVRYPVTKNCDDVFENILPILGKYDIGLIKGHDKAPIYMSPDDPFVSTLVDVYRENTGDMETKPMVIGGGTYSRATENVVAFGGLFNNDEDLMHQKDERMSLESFELMTKIYADAIYKLTQPEFSFNASDCEDEAKEA